MLNQVLMDARVDVPLDFEAVARNIARSEAVGASDTERRAAFHYGRGRSRMLLHKYSEALADFNLAIEADPSDIRPYFDRLWTLSSMYKFANVVSDCNEIAKRFPTSLAVYMMRAEAYKKLGQYENAIDDYSLLIALTLNTNRQVKQVNGGNTHPAVAVAFESRARIYDLMGEVELAQFDRERAAHYCSW